MKPNHNPNQINENLSRLNKSHMTNDEFINNINKQNADRERVKALDIPGASQMIDFPKRLK